MDKNNSMSGAINLLRICTILLAGVSFWATAQGMMDYVFQEQWQAYAASLAVQGMLLGLNFYLPMFVEKTKGKIKIIFLIILTCIVLFCSSWFSYVFIVGKVYSQSWETESQLLVEQNYRTELYNGTDYTKTYEKVLKERLESEMLEIFLTVDSISDKQGEQSDAQINWQKEREIYTAEGFAAKEYMNNVIYAMEDATNKEASLDKMDIAEKEIVQKRKNIETAIENLNKQLEELNVGLQNALNRWESAQSARNNATDEESIKSLNWAVESWTETYKSISNNIKELEAKKSDFETALERLQVYQDQIDSIKGKTDNSINLSLQKIQEEILSESPDVEKMSELAIEVFNSLKNTANVSKDNGSSYMQLLNKMSNFIEKLNDYKILKESAKSFDESIERLREESNETLAENDAWRITWKEKIDKLKSLISGLPLYDENDNEILNQYNRTKSVQILDDVIRTYITEHNAAQQGLIYLMSPYNELAIFTIILALFLDVAAFVTGMLIYVVNKEQGKNNKEEDIEKKENQGDTNKKQDLDDTKDEGHWTVIESANKYIFFTGDYVKAGNEYSYVAYDEGDEITINLESKEIMEAGIYLQEGSEFFKLVPQKLSFEVATLQMCDGIYINCGLHWKEHLLSISDEEGKEEFLANTDENTPVYQMDSASFAIFPVSELQGEKVDMTVVSLNKNGTMVAKIYLLNINN
ncbi:MAG: hypothetical protein PUF12_10475 [Thermoflexaceae bacterium]|nr:hypothetical protein [Thermoflexaceae bacterium]